MLVENKSHSLRVSRKDEVSVSMIPKSMMSTPVEEDILGAYIKYFTKLWKDIRPINKRSSLCNYKSRNGIGMIILINVEGCSQVMIDGEGGEWGSKEGIT